MRQEIIWIVFLYKIRLKYYYPKVKYSEAGILHDTKNILYQIFVKKYCKLMQVCLTFKFVENLMELSQFLFIKINAGLNHLILSSP